MSANLYKAVCARLLQVDCTERINICCLCLGTVGESGASIDDEVVLGLPSLPRPEATTISHMLKFIMDESFSEVMFILKSVCKKCLVAAINSFKFIQSCKDNAKIIATIVEHLEGSFDKIPQDIVNSCNSLYVAVKPNDDSTEKSWVKRYYDKNRLFIPQDTAFLRFKQITENVSYSANQQKLPKQKKIVNVNKDTFENQDGYADEDHSYEEETLQAIEFITCENSESQMRNKLLAAMKDIEQPILEPKAGTKQRDIFSCKNCNMKFSTRNRYVKHIVTKQYTCKRPPKGFGEFKCDYCGYVAFYKHLLIRHIKIKHLGEAEYVCEFCGKNCGSKSELKAHQFMHSKEKRFSCGECGRKYGTEYGLRAHMTIHTGETPYTCYACSKHFRAASFLRDHVIRHHEPPSLKCKVCNRLFKIKQELMSHEAKHSDYNSRVSKRYRAELMKKNGESVGGPTPVRLRRAKPTESGKPRRPRKNRAKKVINIVNEN